MSRILVSGGAGFIGSHCAEALANAGHDVVIVDNLSRGCLDNLPRGVSFVRGDLADPECSSLIADIGAEQCFHFAAQIDVRLSCRDPMSDAQQNIVATLRLIEAGLTAGLRYFCFASSGGAIYGEANAPQDEQHPEVPINPYGVAKLAVDKYLHAYRVQRGLRSTSMRLANVYGPRQGRSGEGGVVAHFLRRLIADEPLLIYGDGQQTRDFIYVEDLALASIALAKIQPQGVLNFGTGVETPIVELAQHVLALRGADASRLRWAPAIAGEQRRSVLNSAAAQACLAWEPRFSLTRGLAAHYAWLLKA